MFRCMYVYILMYVSTYTALHRQTMCSPRMAAAAVSAAVDAAAAAARFQAGPIAAAAVHSRPAAAAGSSLAPHVDIAAD